MLPYFWYLLKVIICSGILFGYYWVFLRNKIFHQYNRFYLLAAMSLSMLLPLLKINFWQPASQKNQAISMLRAVSYGDEYMSNIMITTQKTNWSLEQLYTVIYLLVSLVFLFVMIRTLYLIRTLLKAFPVQRLEEVSFINTNDDSTPFSFLKYIFWNSSIDMNTVTGRQIFKHEVAHVQEKHSYDKLFVNITLVLFWCNPFFWLYRKELNMIHEFIADKKAVEDSDTSAFAAMILQAAYPKHRFELTNNFFYSPIKRRLLMLTKIDNPRLSYIARLMVLPLAVIIFAAFTFKAKTVSTNKSSINKAITLDTLPRVAPSDLAALKTATNDVDSVDYYKDYGYNTTYQGQKIKSVFIRNSDNKAIIKFTNGKQIIMTQAEAFKAKIMMPPPPPPPPPPGMYPNDKRPLLIQNGKLIIVDGVIEDENYIIDEKNIQSVNIIKGDQAISKYGERGRQGVIEIKTKKLTIAADHVIGSKNDTELTMKGNLELYGDLRNTNIYVDDRFITEKVFKTINQEHIESTTNNMIFTQTEVNPQFTGGVDAWRKYLIANLKPATPIDEGWKPGKYTIMVKFIVHVDGSLSNITTENYIGSKTSQHCIDVLKKAPNWQPAIQNGNKVNAYHKQPITFMIEIN